MASWGRSLQPVAPSRTATPDPSSASAVEREGDLACTQPGCGRTTGLTCEYVDRHERSCATAWCPDHRLVIDGHVYCRRHAGVVSALPAGYVATLAPLPDLETRAPSLVSWVAREVDADIRHLLLGELAFADGSELVTDPVYLIFVGCDRRRAWERAWKRTDRRGASLRVSLIVEECADAEVAVQVGPAVVERLAPPWIVQRLHGAQPPPEVDEQRRKDFNRRLLGIVRKGIDREWRPGVRPVLRLVGGDAGHGDGGGWSDRTSPQLS